MNEFETQVQQMAQKALESQDPGISWLGRLLALVVFFASMWWVKRQLAAKEQELAEAKSTLEKTKLQHEWEVFKAEANQLEAEAAKMLQEALALTAATLANVQAQQAQLEDLKTKVAKLSNWEDLNALAGVKP